MTILTSFDDFMYGTIWLILCYLFFSQFIASENSQSLEPRQAKQSLAVYDKGQYTSTSVPCDKMTLQDHLCFRN